MSMPDAILAALAQRARDAAPLDAAALGVARLALIDALARLFEAQDSGAPAACLGPLLPGATFVGGARVPGSALELEPSQAAWCIAWLAGDAFLGGLLPLVDYLARRAVLSGARPARLASLLEAIAQARALASTIRLPAPAHEAPVLESCAARIAVSAVASRLLGASPAESEAAVSLAFAEGLAPLDGSDAGTRARSCAAAASAGVRTALFARAGAPGLPRIVSSRPGGFEASLLGGGQVSLDDTPAPAPASAPPADPLLVWHRFDGAVRHRFNARQAERLLGAIHADAPLETMPVQTFVAALVRPS
jgi:2-methylcitrate dehydratase